MDLVQLTEECLDVNTIYSQVVDHSAGAVSIFVGTTRNHFEGRKVLRLEYEAYASMAEKELHKICKSLRHKWKVEHIAFYHRLGLVPVGEASVVLAISSEHRAESLEALRYAIDTLKATVPIWKKEVYEEGSCEWKSNKECPWAGEAQETNKSQRKIDSSADYVQIKATNEQLEMRIKSFMERKRVESDAANVQEFCHRQANIPMLNSCARTEAVLVSRKDSKSHLRVSRVVNQPAPQPDQQTAPHKPSQTATQTGDPRLPGSIEERVANMEQHLGLQQPVSADVYSRLKMLEDRILYLESVSPEYFDVDLQRPHQQQDVEEYQINQRIAELRRKIKSNNF